MEAYISSLPGLLWANGVLSPICAPHIIFTRPTQFLFSLSLSPLLYLLSLQISLLPSLSLSMLSLFIHVHLFQHLPPSLPLFIPLFHNLSPSLSTFHSLRPRPPTLPLHLFPSESCCMRLPQRYQLILPARWEFRPSREHIRSKLLVVSLSLEERETTKVLIKYHNKVLPKRFPPLMRSGSH